MTITLTKPVEDFIQRLVANGSYPDAAQAVNAACLMWMQEMRAQETPEWRDYVQQKLSEAEHGSFRQMSEPEVDEMFARVRRSAGL